MIGLLKYSKTGSLFAVLAVYVLLILSNIINTYLLNGSDNFIIVFLIFSMVIMPRERLIWLKEYTLLPVLHHIGPVKILTLLNLVRMNIK